MEIKEILRNELELITLDKWIGKFNYDPALFKEIREYRMQIIDKLIDLEKQSTLPKIIGPKY